MLLFPEQKKEKTAESLSTVTTGRVGTWFEGRDVCSASFGLLVWGSAFTVTHQKAALFCQSVLFVCVYTVRVTLWVSHSPLIFSISLRFHSQSLFLWHAAERHRTVQYMYAVRRHGSYVNVDSHIFHVPTGLQFLEKALEELPLLLSEYFLS